MLYCQALWFINISLRLRHPRTCTNLHRPPLSATSLCHPITRFFAPPHHLRFAFCPFTPQHCLTSSLSWFETIHTNKLSILYITHHKSLSKFASVIHTTGNTNVFFFFKLQVLVKIRFSSWCLFPIFAANLVEKGILRNFYSCLFFTKKSLVSRAFALKGHIYWSN